MFEELEDEVESIDTDTLEKRLFEERREMVEFAESNDQWQLFDDQQSIESMRKAIENMDDSELKQEIMKRFQRVEFLYDKYTQRIVKDSL